MRKIVLFLLMFIFGFLPANANPISKYLNSVRINNSAVSVSVKDVSTGRTVFSLNDKTPRNPASTLKILTALASYYTLGADYKFSTKLYKTVNNELYIKLGADPYLSSSDLVTLMGIAQSKKILEPKKIYIDNTIFDNVEWGEGWQWDDDLNPSMPKFSAFNIDNNLINIEISPTSNKRPPLIVTKPYYPVTFMNMVLTDSKAQNNLTLERNNSIAPNIINVSGTISQKITKQIPVNNPQRYFNLRLDEAVKAAKIEYFGSYLVNKLPDKSYFAGEVTHELSLAMNEILKYSDNLKAETVFKLAGGKYANNTANTTNSLAMLDDYFKNLDINAADIKIVDGSGVSKNNIVTADFMTNYLLKIAQKDDFDTVKLFFASPGEGTLKNRMLYFKNNLIAKTGTLSDVSAISGFLTTRSGKVYAFDIMIQDAKTTNSDKKNIEEQILRILFTN